MTRDSEIIRRIREGDAGQFESLFRSSYASLVRYANRLIKDYDTSEEIVQDLYEPVCISYQGSIGGPE